MQKSPIEIRDIRHYENIYGHGKRLQWLRSHLRSGDRIVELGCGTGTMISLPLSLDGFNIIGVDLDKPSINYGRRVFLEHGLDPERLQDINLHDLETPIDVVIASEVLEHIPDGEWEEVLRLIRTKLRPGGRLLVTVPNGYGWFEAENWLWTKVGIGSLLIKLRLYGVIQRFKKLVCGGPVDYEYASTLADSPHVQWFTRAAIERRLRQNGFIVRECTGSVLAAGPLSHLFGSGIRWVMRLNGWLGSLLPRCAAGFYLSCQVADVNEQQQPLAA